MSHRYWLRKVAALHEHLEAQVNQLLYDKVHLEWLTPGWMVLIPKATSMDRLKL